MQYNVENFGNIFHQIYPMTAYPIQNKVEFLRNRIGFYNGPKKISHTYTRISVSILASIPFIFTVSDKSGKVLLHKNTRTKLIEFLAGCSSATVVMEAYTGTHFMARRIVGLGHKTKLISPQFVRPFVKSNKNDFVDVEAICEAASHPSIRFVQPQIEAQQATRALHRVRESLIKDKVKTTNQMHAFLLEFGISLPRGKAVIKLLSFVLEEHSSPDYVTRLLMQLHAHYLYLVEQLTELEYEIKRTTAQDDTVQNFMTIPGIGLITASLLSSQLGNGRQYAKSRDFVASVGLVPRQYSTGGNKNLRRLLVICARVFMQRLGQEFGKLASFNVVFWCTDNFKAYNLLPKASFLSEKPSLNVLSGKI